MKKELSNALIYPPVLCPLALTLDVIGGKWKPLIVHLVSQGVNRFSLLEKQLPGISRKMLANQLRELERDELLTREIFAEIPPRVEYSLTETGLSLLAAVMPLYEWGVQHLAHKQPRHTAIQL
ncbi:winged helix-turn-helix transcriptional regulator [Chitinophaga sp. 22321]|uniref:Helix-turn-helix transcriptional regulator n=1 Tax=Chitinophaga hostae TaxID=2831022 RepID=A0ABS5J6E2_9BACT|nr:helix-turn-helix domain-containing protein [Chitinophaga hostae]MBS0030789.1 helix-turn-helix transcriptional regulator [Chitinophaga hostae]